MVLTFLVESLVVRHYGLAVVFITPLTILLADAAMLGGDAGAVDRLVRARFLDAALGCMVGLLGGICLHSPRLRGALGRALRALLPRRRDPGAG